MERPGMKPLVVQVGPVHKRALEHLAEECGEAMSVTLRRLIREEAQRQNVWQVTQREHEVSEEAAHA